MSGEIKTDPSRETVRDDAMRGSHGNPLGCHDNGV